MIKFSYLGILKRERKGKMEEKILYKSIYKDTNMAIFTLKETLKKLKEKDNKIKEVIGEIIKGYERYNIQAKEKLKEDELEENGSLSKMFASHGIGKEIKKDNSDSSIADMLIEGISMGSLDIEKKIKSYKKAEKEEKKMAEDFYKFQKDIITNLKKFL